MKTVQTKASPLDTRRRARNGALVSSACLAAAAVMAATPLTACGGEDAASAGLTSSTTSLGGAGGAAGGGTGIGGSGSGGETVAGGAGGGGPTEGCANGVDDDGDTLIDCADADCAGFWLCPSDGSEWVQIDWGQIGPTPQGGPHSIVSVVPDAQGRIVVGTLTGGVWRSADIGLHWEQLPVDPIDPDVKLFRLASDPAGVLFAGVEGRAYPDELAKIYRSSDGGDTWKLVAAHLDDSANPNLHPQVTCSFTFPSPGVVVAGSGWLKGLGGVFVSSDGGDNWTNTSGDPTAKKSVVMGLGVAPDGALLSGSEGLGTNRSADLGKTWTPVQGSLTQTTQTWQFVFEDGVGYAAAQGYPDGGVHLSLDDGLTWERLGPPPGYPTGVVTVAVGKDGYLAAGTLKQGAIESLDGGKTWAVVDELPKTTVRSLAFDAAGYLYAGTTNNQDGNVKAGVYRTTKPR